MQIFQLKNLCDYVFFFSIHFILTLFNHSFPNKVCPARMFLFFPENFSQNNRSIFTPLLGSSFVSSLLLCFSFAGTS